MAISGKDSLIKHLKTFVYNPLIIKNNINCHIYKTFEKCLNLCFNEKGALYDCILEIESVLDYLHEELNTGHWSKVPIEHRHNFTTASFVKTILLLTSEEFSSELLRRCLKAVDMGLLLGAPLEENPELLTECAKYLQTELNLMEPMSINVKSIKRRISSTEQDFDKLNGNLIEKVYMPSIETFNKKYFAPQIPVKLKGCMAHWPASTKWLDLNYLLKVLGNRTVPIEIGSHYTDENWSQKLMTAKDFITKHYLSDSGDVGYLAQHNLFDQITELKEDIRIPEYCS
ncbi:bifunctional peptidase and arginyl-hydroxylase JMJD5-like [Anthonomus grandis grandis]|uniref:bifunctional peptidase and arginyl-hydroxylase JMJD5-like n=1 Tax=Anthonomus grandis grandis TaxID=2921223 RepID=UPI0021650FC2|nr:bifunctional peptidase and arginyl-hydroxylase JMJD5-like [Anthonomus grandis grandis]